VRGGTTIRDELTPIVYALLIVSFAAELYCAYLLRPVLAEAPHVYGQQWAIRYVVFYALLGGAALADLRFAVMILARSLLAAAAAASRVWWPRAMGAQAYAEVLAQAARQGTRAPALLGVAVSAGFLAVLGGMICWLSSGWWQDPEFWVGLGVILYGLQQLTESSKLYARLYRASKAGRTGPGAAPN
jgi:hypothetical protein